ncbi:SDR family oxidoreductase [Mesonia maritima]|uniref:SDR family oxidoreductase n=1 Tax=Mesonia maritima TaxID=1793873 RepID=UPI00363A7625
MKTKVALITGASSGIGKAIVEKLAAENCKIILASRDIEKLNKIQKELKVESLAVKMDVTDSDSVANAFQKIKEKFSTIDILVNCAGVMPLSYLKNRHIEEWMQTIDVNVKGTLRCIYEVLPDMKSQKNGHIINIASVDGKEIFEGGAIYGASKAAVIELSKRCEWNFLLNLIFASLL